MAPRPNCTATLHGVRMTTGFTEEEFQALVRDKCKTLAPSSDQLVRFQAPPFSEQAARFFHAPKFSIDAVLEAPLSEDDALMLSDQFSDEEVVAILTRQLPAKKRKRQPPSRRPSSSSHAAAFGQPALGPRRAAKNARLLRGWHEKIAARILTGRFRSPDPSRGRKTRRCQCSELAAAAADGGCCCALHQDAGAAGEEFARKVRRRVPIAAGPGEVRVPTLARKDGAAKVTQYMHWRRAVWMPTRFYLEAGARRGAGSGSMDEQLQDD